LDTVEQAGQEHPSDEKGGDQYKYFTAEGIRPY
jgi:hypothetical protein